MMKFKWIGSSGIKDIDLVNHGILTPDVELRKGMIIDIPDTEKELIQRVKINGNYEVVLEKVTKKTDKKKEEK